MDNQILQHYNLIHTTHQMLIGEYFGESIDKMRVPIHDTYLKTVQLFLRSLPKHQDPVYIARVHATTQLVDQWIDEQTLVPFDDLDRLFKTCDELGKIAMAARGGDHQIFRDIVVSVLSHIYGLVTTATIDKIQKEVDDEIREQLATSDVIQPAVWEEDGSITCGRCNIRYYIQHTTFQRDGETMTEITGVEHRVRMHTNHNQLRK